MQTATIDEVLLEKIHRFQDGISELYEMTQNYHLRGVLTTTGDRYVLSVRDALQSCTKPMFTRTDMERAVDIIKSGGTEADISEHVADQLFVAQKAEDLIDLYVEILGIPHSKTSHGYNDIKWHKGPSIDRLTA